MKVMDVRNIRKEDFNEQELEAQERLNRIYFLIRKYALKKHGSMKYFLAWDLNASKEHRIAVATLIHNELIDNGYEINWSIKKGISALLTVEWVNVPIDDDMESV